MRIETQKQIVKAFAMLYEDTEMPLSELIEKLQQLAGGNPKAKAKSKLSEPSEIKATDEQLLNFLREKQEPVKTKEIALHFGYTSAHGVRLRLKKLINSKQIVLKKINSKLSEYSLA